MILKYWITLGLFIFYLAGLALFVKRDRNKEWISIIYLYSIFILTLPIYVLSDIFPRSILIRAVDCSLHLLLLYQVYRVIIIISGFYSRITAWVFYLILALSFFHRLLVIIPESFLTHDRFPLFFFFKDSLAGFFVDGFLFLQLLVLGFRGAKNMEKQSSSKSSYLLIWIALTLISLQIRCLFILGYLDFPLEKFTMLLSLAIALYAERNTLKFRRRKEEQDPVQD